MTPNKRAGGKDGSPFLFHSILNALGPPASARMLDRYDHPQFQETLWCWLPTRRMSFCRVGDKCMALVEALLTVSGSCPHGEKARGRRRSVAPGCSSCSASRVVGCRRAITLSRGRPCHSYASEGVVCEATCVYLEFTHHRFRHWNGFPPCGLETLAETTGCTRRTTCSPAGCLTRSLHWTPR